MWIRNTPTHWWEEHNSTHPGAAVVDPSEELIGVTNVFLRWYKLFRQTTPGKTAADITLLRSLSLRYVSIMRIIHIILLIYIIYNMTLMTLIHFIWISTLAKLTFPCFISGCWTYSEQCFPTQTNWIAISWTQKKSILSSTVMLT